jgi:hypothetical protein
VPGALPVLLRVSDHIDAHADEEENNKKPMTTSILESW